ncbi:S8 family serine peptidase [bacterium]|nr:S8 family serine peptidase [bacterium]
MRFRPFAAAGAFVTLLVLILSESAAVACCREHRTDGSGDGGSTVDASSRHRKTAVPVRRARTRCLPMLDVSLPAVYADQVHAGVQGTVLTGEGVLVGIIDSGIDWRHADFITSSGRTRILRIWDQTDDEGPAPASFTYGSEYTQTDIQNELDGVTDGSVREADIWGHGTHIAGIAAGNGGAEARYVGVAPDAELIVVKSGNYQFEKETILDALDYIFACADYLDRPVAVNISVGSTHYGPHDGSSAFESGIDDRLWRPGRAVVVAAGNSGDDPVHFKEDLVPAESADITFTTSGNQAGVEDYLSWDIWSAADDDIRFTLITPDGHRLGPVNRGEIGILDSDNGYLYISNGAAGPDAGNGLLETEILVSDSRSGGAVIDNLSPGAWTLRCLNGDPARSTSWFHGWLYDASMNASLSSGADYSCLLPEPANARLCISVGSFVTRDRWPAIAADPWGPYVLDIGGLSDFSSPGPTRDGRQKPEIVAPGEFILSARSSSMAWPDDYYTASDSLHRAWSGTSMSAPHVTGTIALMLQKNPGLTSSQIKSVLIGTALRDEFTGSELWTGKRGFGKLNSLDAVLHTDSAVPVLPGNDLRGSIPALTCYPNPCNATAHITWSAPAGRRVTLRLYTIRGREVATLADARMEEGVHSLVWEPGGSDRTLPSGLYICILFLDGSITESCKILLLK